MLRILLMSCILASLALGLAPQAALSIEGNIPRASISYQDFTAWYLGTYDLAELPYRAAALIDANTGTPLYFHQETTVMPTASLIKMVTAGTMLSYGRDWYSLVGFTEADNEGLLRPYVGAQDKFSLLKLAPEERITLEQSLASMLIGSANNAAVAMPRAVGVTREEFIAAMRATAARWGMTRTTVDEPSGLSLTNTSTAQDLARAACAVYSDFITSFYGSSPSVSFTTSQGTKKTVLHTVYDLRAHPERYFGAKTGYLTETQYHVAAGIITPDGHRLCAAVLTSPSRAESEHALNALRLWADEMYEWNQ